MLSSTPSYLSGKGSCHLQVIGMHFMNPPPIMRLVEIVRGADTSDASFSATKSLAERSLEEYVLFWFELVSYIFVTCGCPLSLSQRLYIPPYLCSAFWKPVAAQGCIIFRSSLSFTCASGIFRFGKTVICSQDYPGFIVNRILMPMINESFYTLYTGVGSKEDIDTGMKLGTNHPMGPLELADFIGLDVCLSIMKILHGGFGDGRYAPCPLLVQYVDAGRLGRKRGIGVYNYRKAVKETSLSGRL